MALWRVTCPMEERYVVADTCDLAGAIASKSWSGKKVPEYSMTGIALVSPYNPWPDDAGKPK